MSTPFLAPTSRYPDIGDLKGERDIKYHDVGDERGNCHLHHLFCTHEQHEGAYDKINTGSKMTKRAPLAERSSETSTEIPEITITECIV